MRQLIRSPVILLAVLFQAAAAEPTVILSEIMAANSRTLASDSKRFDDWIELRNLSSNAVDLAGWAIRNSAKATPGWVLPSTNLPAGGHLLIWASGLDRRKPGAPLHTSFKLSSSGEYLGLIRPDGSIASEFAPRFPSMPPDVSYGILSGATHPAFFASPTPGTANETSTNLPAASGVTVRIEPELPKAGESVKVRVALLPLTSPIHSVSVAWRVMFRRETNLVLRSIGPNLWEGVIPSTNTEAGDILRWRVLVQDEAGHTTRSPLAGNPQVSSRYHGVRVAGPIPESALPVFQLFVPPSQINGMDSEGGGRGCVVYDGEFYDNVFIKVRGNTTAGFPKKSHRLEFPHDHPFRHPGPGGRVRHTSLMAEYGDPTYLRQYLSFWLQSRAGSAAPFHYPVRVELNGTFYQLAMHSEVLGEQLLSRNGLDPEGALYKAVGTLTPGYESTGGFEKKTRHYEETEDYLELAEALGAHRSHDEVRRALFERMHLPSVLNYLAAARISQEDDDIWANMSLYHDCDGSQLWRPIPFDMNVSWGFSFATGEILATADDFRSHPFFGAARIGANQGFNRLYHAVVRIPETRAMLLRRMRTLMDQTLQPPGTPLAQRIIEREISVQTNRFWKEATLDRARWGLPWNVSSAVTDTTSLSVGVSDLIERFIEPRRQHLFENHSILNTARPVGVSARNNAGIPLSQAAELPVGLEQWTGTGKSSLVSVTNGSPLAVDLSGWKLTGGARFTFEEGTVLPPQGRLYVTSDLTRSRNSLQPVVTNATAWLVGGTTVRWTEGSKIHLRNRQDHKVSELPQAK